MPVVVSAKLKEVLTDEMVNAMRSGITEIIQGIGDKEAAFNIDLAEQILALANATDIASDIAKGERTALSNGEVEAFYIAIQELDKIIEKIVDIAYQRDESHPQKKSAITISHTMMNPAQVVRSNLEMIVEEIGAEIASKKSTGRS